MPAAGSRVRKQRASRIRHSIEEKAKILQAVLELREQSPGATTRQLWLAGIRRSLPADRMPNSTNSTPRYRYAWLEEALRLHDMQAASMGSAPAATAVVDMTPAQAAVEPTPRELAHALVDRLFDPDPTREDAITRRLAEIARVLAESDARHHAEIAGLRETVVSLQQAVGRLQEASEGLSSRIRRMHLAFGELVGEDPSPPERPESAAEPAPVITLEPTAPAQPQAAPRVKIGLIGPLPDQVAAVRSRIPDSVDILVAEKEAGSNLVARTLDGCDYIIVTRHAQHRHQREAQNAIGKERVWRLRTGGVTSVAKKINELVGSR